MAQTQSDPNYEHLWLIADQMKQLEARGDVEGQHHAADALLCDLVLWLADGRASHDDILRRIVESYKRVPKWYS